MQKKKKLDENKVRKKIKKLRKQLPEPQKCSFCPNPLFDMMVSADTEPHTINGKPACKMCYFEQLGEILEKHPIGVIPKRIKVF